MKILNPSILKKLNLPPVGQVGIIVEDLKTAVPQYSSLLNIHPWYRARISKKEIVYRENPILLDLDIAVGYSGRLQFELIQVLKGEDNIYTDLIQTRGQGFHHIGFMVSDIARKMDVFETAGLKRIQHGTFETKGGVITRFAYYDSMEELGYITELIQTTLFGITIGMPGWMMRIGCLIGDVNLIK
jgi:catechol 2,3-dioxygenase-like lactoylglutathione lyase family enzyme